VGKSPHKISIEERPKIVDEKERIGDLEIDLVIGTQHKKAILTVNDRVTGMAKMALLESKSSKQTKQKLVEILTEWKPFLKTITSDNGKEFALHREIATELNVEYFFARPYHSWERGANENLNGLIRQYFPKNYDFNLVSEQDIANVENKLNNRPRKRLGFLTPNQVYLQHTKKHGESYIYNLNTLPIKIKHKTALRIIFKENDEQKHRAGLGYFYYDTYRNYFSRNGNFYV